MTLANTNTKTGPDKILLDVTAMLIDQDPEDLLDKLCEQVGNELISYRRLKNKELPVMVKHELKAIYHKRMAIEEEILKNCKESSKELFKYAGYAIVIGFAVLYFLSRIF